MKLLGAIFLDRVHSCPSCTSAKYLGFLCKTKQENHNMLLLTGFILCTQFFTVSLHLTLYILYKLIFTLLPAS